MMFILDFFFLCFATDDDEIRHHHQPDIKKNTGKSLLDAVMIKLVMKQNKTRKWKIFIFFIFDKQRKSSHPIHSIFDSNKQTKI